MIEFLFWVSVIALAYRAVLWALPPRHQPRYPSADEIYETVLHKTADDLEMDVEQLRELMKRSELADLAHKPKLRVVK